MLATVIVNQDVGAGFDNGLTHRVRIAPSRRLEPVRLFDLQSEISRLDVSVATILPPLAAPASENGRPGRGACLLTPDGVHASYGGRTGVRVPPMPRSANRCLARIVGSVAQPQRSSGSFQRWRYTEPLDPLQDRRERLARRRRFVGPAILAEVHVSGDLRVYRPEQRARRRSFTD